ncbi:DNA replication/repair protein RecF [Porticoccus sp.]
MPLTKLDVFGLRNLKSVQLTLSPAVNIFYGNNGSGKTSLLEAVFLLGRARSFRSRILQSVINADEHQCTVFGLTQNLGSAMPVGVTRNRQGGGVFKVGGQAVSAASSLAEALPLLLINQDSFNLLEGSPQHRRRFVDWGVFHVEHGCQQLVQRFQRILKQRNSLLRHDRIGSDLLGVWDQEFEDVACAITTARENYLQQLLPIIRRVLSELSPTLEYVDFELYAGWDNTKPLSSILETDRRRDQQFKTTHHGPHRADLKIRFERHMANEHLSRGQIKILAIAMLLAQGYLFHQRTGRHCVYLVDDLAAELDVHHKKLVGKLLLDMGAQVLITGTDMTLLRDIWTELQPEQIKVFHVEHGQIHEIKADISE